MGGFALAGWLRGRGGGFGGHVVGFVVRVCATCSVCASVCVRVGCPSHPARGVVDFVRVRTLPGFLVSPDYLCWHNILESPRAVRLDDIVDVRRASKDANFEVGAGRKGPAWLRLLSCRPLPLPRPSFTTCRSRPAFAALTPVPTRGDVVCAGKRWAWHVSRVWLTCGQVHVRGGVGEVSIHQVFILGSSDAQRDSWSRVLLAFARRAALAPAAAAVAAPATGAARSAWVC
jgi:hypothetical protein